MLTELLSGAGLTWTLGFNAHINSAASRGQSRLVSGAASKNVDMIYGVLSLSSFSLSSHFLAKAMLLMHTYIWFCSKMQLLNECLK